MIVAATIQPAVKVSTNFRTLSPLHQGPAIKKPPAALRDFGGIEVRFVKGRGLFKTFGGRVATGALGSGMAWFSLHVLSAICIAGVFSGMILFTVAPAPTTFRTLDRPQAARLMRQVFQRYCKYLAVHRVAGAGILMPAHSHGVEVGILAISCIINLLLRQFFLPYIDRVSISDPATSLRLDRLSVIIKIGLLDAVAVIFARRAQ